MVLLAMGLPILVWLVVVAAVVQFDFHGGSWFCLLAIVNFWAIFKLTFTKTPNFIWVILFTTMVIALILVIWQVVREYDLIVSSILAHVDPCFSLSHHMLVDGGCFDLFSGLIPHFSPTTHYRP